MIERGLRFGCITSTNPACQGTGWKTLTAWAGLLSAAAAQTVSDAAADAAANAADKGEDQRGHHRRDDRPEPPDGLAGAILALGHYVSALVVHSAGPSVEFGKSLSDGGLSIIEDLCSVT